MVKKFQSYFIEKSERTESEYYEMLGCVPPRAMVDNAFLVGEIYDHGGEGNAARYDLYFCEGEKYYYGGLCTLKDFNLFTIEQEIPAAESLLNMSREGRGDEWVAQAKQGKIMRIM